MKVERILFPTDFSECANRALDYAVLAAAKLDAELHVVHICALHLADPNDPRHQFPSERELDEALDRLAQLEIGDLPVPRGVRCVRHTVRGISVGPTIIDFAKWSGTDLIVMGTHGRTGLPHVLLGSVAEHVIARSPVPVLTVGKPRFAGESVVPHRKLLVAVDFSAESKRALTRAVELARLFHAKLVVAHVVEDVPHAAYYLFGKSSVLEVFPHLADRCRAELKRIIHDAGSENVEAEALVVEGRCHAKIVELAREHGVDLIVLGCRGSGSVERLLTGSVTARVVRAASCPVLAVK